MPVDPELLEILACPACKTPVKLVKDGTALKCNQCHRVYPIKDDIPVMLTLFSYTTLFRSRKSVV